MKRKWQSFLVLLVANALLSGAVLGHYASGSRSSGASMLWSSPRLPGTAAEGTGPGSDGADSFSVGSDTVSHSESRVSSVVSDPPSESFHQWFQKYRATNPDTHRL